MIYVVMNMGSRDSLILHDYFMTYMLIYFFVTNCVKIPYLEWIVKKVVIGRWF